MVFEIKQRKNKTVAQLISSIYSELTKQRFIRADSNWVKNNTSFSKRFCKDRIVMKERLAESHLHSIASLRIIIRLLEPEI